MQNLQDIFSRIRSTKREQKQINNAYKDALASSAEYKDVVEKIRGYKLRKKQIEDDIKAELGSEYVRLESLKKDIQNDKELLTDIAINQLMAGETVRVEDEDKNLYDPIFSVKFKKTNEVAPESN